MYQTVGPISYIIHRLLLLAQRLHALAVEVLNTQLLYTHIQRDNDSTTAPSSPSQPPSLMMSYDSLPTSKTCG